VADLTINVFDIVGPIMIGPSSSHTAGAVRLGKLARLIFGNEPKKADIFLHGSFAKTYKGHGTDVALVAGLLGFDPDDDRISQALELAKNVGLEIKFIPADLGSVHPNTVKFVLSGAKKTRTILGSSIGGGNIVVTQIDDFVVDLRGNYNTIIATYTDRTGMVASLSALLAEGKVNIAKMKVARVDKGAEALMVIETDNPIDDITITKIRQLEGIQSLFRIPPI
jgi:L-serine dehydratase